jgi:hypothetical protein
MEAKTGWQLNNRLIQPPKICPAHFNKRMVTVSAVLNRERPLRLTLTEPSLLISGWLFITGWGQSQDRFRDLLVDCVAIRFSDLVNSDLLIKK